MLNYLGSCQFLLVELSGKDQRSGALHCPCQPAFALPSRTLNHKHCNPIEGFLLQVALVIFFYHNNRKVTEAASVHTLAPHILNLVLSPSPHTSNDKAANLFVLCMIKPLNLYPHVTWVNQPRDLQKFLWKIFLPEQLDIQLCWRQLGTICYRPQTQYNINQYYMYYVLSTKPLFLSQEKSFSLIIKVLF